MFIEKREQGKSTKYYLVHTYRIGKKVKRISRYLGSNLTKKQLEKLKERAGELLREQVKDNHPFELSKDELREYKKYEESIKVSHLQKTLDWEQFTKDFVYNTNAIEGSEVEYGEVKDLLDKKEKPENLDEIETINVAKAIEFVRKTRLTLSLGLIKKLHKICFDKTKSFAGNFRNVEIVVKDPLGNVIHTGAPAREIRNLLEEMIEWYKNHKRKYPPLFLASLVHNQFEYIHPFQDGNGRVGRLLLNYILLKHSYPPLSVNLKDRKEYYRVLGVFDKTGDIKPTIRFFMKQYRKVATK